MLFKNIILITVIILLSTLMTKIKSANLRTERKYDTSPESNSLNYNSFQTRHNHLFRKKHYKCNLERFYGRQNFQVEKQSRYPTLDKIVNRLDNQIDRDLTRTKATTFNPYDLWDLTAANPVVDKTSKYSYVSMGSKNGTRVVGYAKNMHTGKLDKTQPSWIKSADPGEIKSNARQQKDPDKGTFILSVIENFTKDMTSPGPWVHIFYFLFTFIF